MAVHHHTQPIEDKDRSDLNESPLKSSQTKGKLDQYLERKVNKPKGLKVAKEVLMADRLDGQ